VTARPAGFGGRRSRRIRSDEQGQIYKINGEIYLGYPGYKVLPEIPENFVAKPTLRWFYDNRTKEAHKLEVSYLTSDMSWKADYRRGQNRTYPKR